MVKKPSKDIFNRFRDFEVECYLSKAMNRLTPEIALTNANSSYRLTLSEFPFLKNEILNLKEMRLKDLYFKFNLKIFSTLK